MSALKASAAEDKDVLAVTKQTAEKYSLSSISDLSAHASGLVLGGPPEWKTRHEGVTGLKDVYGLTFKEFRALDAGGPLTLAALKNGQVDAGDMFSTDPAMEDLVALKDDKSLFAAQNVVPIVRNSSKTKKVESVLDKVSSNLTTSDLVEMNARLANKEDMGKVAQDWLKSKSIG
jgi:osmoprotectant transport system substrate-binding protein